jgi:hypothetical protein
MTRLNEYIWELPHSPTPDDPMEVTSLAQQFNNPLTAHLDEALSTLGYELRSSDIMVPPDKMVLMEDMGSLANTYKANVRYIRYLRPEVITRIHFEHQEWSLGQPNAEQRQFQIILDRFLIADRATMRVEPAWGGRLHTLVSSRPGAAVLHYSGEDKLWTYTNSESLLAAVDAFLDKFRAGGQAWLEDPALMG